MKFLPTTDMWTCPPPAYSDPLITLAQTYSWDYSIQVDFYATHITRTTFARDIGEFWGALFDTQQMNFIWKYVLLIILVI